MAYATEADMTAFAAYLGSIPDVGRLLERASELLDDHVRRPFAVGDNQLPTDPDVAEALKQATCAQVEFWVDVGEEHDVEGLHHRKVSIGHLTTDLPPELGPRAVRFLRQANLLSSTAIDTTAGRFFASQSGV